MKFKYFILFSVLFLISCDRDTYEVNNVIGVYKQQGSEKKSIRLFTKSGEIKDQQLIAAFIKRTELASLASYYTKSKIDGSQPLEIEIVNGSKAKILHNNKVTYREIVKKNDYFYLESEEEFGKVSDRIDVMYHNIAMHHPIHYQVADISPLSPLNTDETDLSKEWQTTTPEGKPFLFKHCYYLKPDKGMLIMPMLDFRIKTTTFAGLNIKHWCKQNELKNVDKVMKYLISNDTLLIQESSLIYKK